jgi:hypothetical protein
VIDFALTCGCRWCGGRGNCGCGIRSGECRLTDGRWEFLMRRGCSGRILMFEPELTESSEGSEQCLMSPRRRERCTERDPQRGSRERQPDRPDPWVPARRQLVGAPGAGSARQWISSDHVRPPRLRPVESADRRMTTEPWRARSSPTSRRPRGPAEGRRSRARRARHRRLHTSVRVDPGAASGADRRLYGCSVEGGPDNIGSAHPEEVNTALLTFLVRRGSPIPLLWHVVTSEFRLT